MRGSVSPVSDLQRAKAISAVQGIVQNSIIKANEGRLDRVLGCGESQCPVMETAFLKLVCILAR